jgi:hypothetical protein
MEILSVEGYEMKNPQCVNCTGDLTEKNLRHRFITPKDGAVAGRPKAENRSKIFATLFATLYPLESKTNAGA